VVCELKAYGWRIFCRKHLRKTHKNIIIIIFLLLPFFFAALFSTASHFSLHDHSCHVMRNERQVLPLNYTYQQTSLFSSETRQKELRGHISEFWVCLCELFDLVFSLYGHCVRYVPLSWMAHFQFEIVSILIAFYSWALCWTQIGKLCIITGLMHWFVWQ